MNYQNQYQIIRQIIQIAQKWQDRANKIVGEEIGITVKQWMLLSALEDEFENHLPSLNEVSESFGTSRQNTKRLILELQKKKFLIIANDPGDKRILRIALTGKHREFFKSNMNHKLYEDITNEYFKDLNETEFIVMEKAIFKILNRINPI